MGATSEKTIAGRHVTGFTAKESGVKYLDLREWAAARGASITSNTSIGHESFAKGGVQNLLPWGGDHIKLGAQWRRMADVLMAANGRAYVSEAELEG